MKYNFQEDLKSIRKILGFSQQEFAEQMGVEQITVSRNESGRTTGKKTTKSRPRFEDVPEQRQQRQRRTRSEQRVR